MTQRWPALAPLTGILFVVLAVAAFIVGGETPSTTDSAEEILSFYQDEETEQFIAALLLGWGTVAFLFFVGVLRTVLHTAEGAIARLSAVAFAGGIVAAVGMAAFASLTFALANGADDYTPEAAQALNALNNDFFFPLAVGVGTLLIATAIVGIRTGALPRAASWIALILGILAITPLGFFAFLGFLAWVLAMSVILWRAARTNLPPAQA
jgi:hypothetical protein